MKLLKRLSQGGSYSNKSIANELGIDEGLAEQMIMQLQKLKYIEKDKIGGCNKLSADNSCGKKGGCSCCNSNTIKINMWRLTEKGKNAI